MVYEGLLWIGEDQGEKLCIRPEMANRHGLIAGATGTGKTVTLKVMAESFSDLGIPVFLADVKGDLAGMCRPGQDSPQMRARLESLGLKEAGFSYHSYPVCFWDIFGEKGLPLRTTISEMGPTLLARLMGLTDTQTDVLTIVFRIADEEGLLLLDTKDLRAMLLHAAQQNKEYASRYGSLPKQSINSILRNLASLEEQGAEQFFGEPALDIRDWFRQDSQGRGMINILHSESLIHNPKMYSTFMLWMVSELFEILPEAGDCPKPKMVFFFDEAHLLFDDAPKALMQKLEQVVKLVRSKGVGIYFITQSPKDIPDGILGQLGNKIQHALHAYTPAEQKAVKAAADSFRENPAFDTRQVMGQLGIGEALVSFLDKDGIPGMVRRSRILAPQSFMGPISDGERKARIEGQALYARYGVMIDRDSAYEFFQRRSIQQENEERQLKEEEARKKEEEKAAKEAEKEAQRQEKEKARELERQEKALAREAQKRETAKKRAVASVAKSAAGTIGREVGNEIGKNVGGSFGKRLGGNLGASIGRGIFGTLFGK
ncbi:MAG: DUF853 family protein [Hungatella sp.]|jgi:DNA helicase HerA-like ATPase|nr:DUF853 family protein [Hungatella sp.]